VVHASVLPEPFGQVVVEAMAAGRPVIATAAGGPLEVIRDGYDGLLVPPGDVSAMARAMRRLADDELLRRRLAEHGRVRVGDFAPERLGPQVERVYRRVAR
jgi:glycosyltransferase involved in cell wall biosynthesis